jgi:hypothetical protein
LEIAAYDAAKAADAACAATRPEDRAWARLRPGTAAARSAALTAEARTAVAAAPAGAARSEPSARIGHTSAESKLEGADARVSRVGRARPGKATTHRAAAAVLLWTALPNADRGVQTSLPAARTGHTSAERRYPGISDKRAALLPPPL